MRSGLAVDESALEWIRWLLGPNADGIDGRARTRRDGPVGHYLALPNSRKPRVIVPADSPRAARAVLAGTLGNRGAARRLAGAAIRVGRFPPGLGAAFTVPARSAAGSPSLAARFSELLDVPDLMVGLTVGSPRPNRKPVLKLVTADGTIHGYAKVAWNPLTESLVVNEGNWLRRIADQQPPGLLAPVPWKTTTWKGLPVLVTRPLEHLSSGSFRADAELLSTIADLAPGGVHRSVGSPWWRSIGQRVAMVEPGLPRDVLGRALDHAATGMGAAEWRFGAWHGDLTRWNASPVDVGTAVWDWERAGGPAPIGIDAAHAEFQTAMVTGRVHVSGAASAADAALATLLPQLDLDPSHSADLVTCYLIERYLRWDEDRRQGSTTATARRHHAILGAVVDRTLQAVGRR